VRRRGGLLPWPAAITGASPMRAAGVLGPAMPRR
jgi:hypothetical protein